MRLELFGGLTRIGRTFTRWSQLDLVALRDGQYERHDLLSGVTGLSLIGRELARAMGVPIERVA